MESGHRFVYKGDENASIRGIGLYKHKRWSDHIRVTRIISSRVLYVTLRFNKKYCMKVIQAYAPTASSEDEEIECFYDDVSTAIEENRTNYMYLIGDFNARLGKRIDDEEDNIDTQDTLHMMEQ